MEEVEPLPEDYYTRPINLTEGNPLLSVTFCPYSVIWAVPGTWSMGFLMARDLFASYLPFTHCQKQRYLLVAFELLLAGEIEFHRGCSVSAHTYSPSRVPVPSALICLVFCCVPSDNSASAAAAARLPAHLCFPALPASQAPPDQTFAALPGR